MNIEKLKRLQAQVRIGGKGTPRRKKKVMHQTAATDDKKLQSSLKKLSVSTIPGIEEVNIIKDDLTVIHFNNPKAQASLSANTFAVTGHGETKKIVEMLPEILPQLGQETVVQLRMFANSMTNNQKGGIDGFEPKLLGNCDEDDVPLLVGDFDEIAKKEDSKTRPNKNKILNTENENPSHITHTKVETKKQNIKKNSNENSTDNTKKVELLKMASTNKDNNFEKNDNIKETEYHKIDSKTIEIKANIGKDSDIKSTTKAFPSQTHNEDKNERNNLTPIENIVKSNPTQCLNIKEDPVLKIISNEKISSLTKPNELSSDSVSDNKITKSTPLFEASVQQKSKENKNIQLIEKQPEHPKLESIDKFLDGSSLTDTLPAIQKEVTNKEFKEDSTSSVRNIAGNEHNLQSAVNPQTKASLVENKIGNQQEIQAVAIPADSIINLKGTIDIKDLQTGTVTPTPVLSSDNTKQDSTEVTNVAISTPAVPDIKHVTDIHALPLSSMEDKKAAQDQLQPAATIPSKLSCSEKNNENTQNININVCTDLKTVNVSPTCHSSEKQVDIALKLSGSLPEIGKMQEGQELTNVENENKIGVLTMTLEENVLDIDQSTLVDENRIQSESKSKQDDLQPATTISSKISCSENNNENAQNININVCKDFQIVNVSPTRHSTEKQIDIALKPSGSLPEIEKMQEKQELTNLENENKIEELTMTLEKNTLGIDQTVLLNENKIQMEDKSKQAAGVNVNLQKKNNIDLNTKAAVQSSTQKKDAPKKDATKKDAIKRQPTTTINSKKPDNANKLKPTKSISPQSLSGAAPIKHETPKPEADTLVKQEKSIMTGAKPALSTSTKPQISATPKTPTMSKPKKVVSQPTTDHPPKTITVVKAPPGVDQNSSAPAKLRPENNNSKGKKVKAQAEVTDTAIKQTQQNKSGQQKLTEDPTRAKASETAKQSKPAQQKLKEDKTKTQASATDSPSAPSKSSKIAEEKVTES